MQLITRGHERFMKKTLNDKSLNDQKKDGSYLACNLFIPTMIFVGSKTINISLKCAS